MFADYLDGLRELATSRMEESSRCDIFRRTGAMTTNAEGFEVPAYDAVYLGIPCRIDAGGSSDGGSRGVNIDGITYEEATGTGHFPYPSDLLAADDLVLITTGEWPDVCYRIVAAVTYDQKTARRLPIVSEPIPEGLS